MTVHYQPKNKSKRRVAARSQKLWRPSPDTQTASPARRACISTEGTGHLLHTWRKANGLSIDWTPEDREFLLAATRKESGVRPRKGTKKMHINVILRGAYLRGVDLRGANLRGSTIIETGETWGEYLSKVVPSLLTAGGKALSDVLSTAHWECHSWENCPMAAAFSGHGIDDVPILLRPRAEQFIRYFDARLIPLDKVGVPGSAKL